MLYIKESIWKLCLLEIEALPFHYLQTDRSCRVLSANFFKIR